MDNIPEEHKKLLRSNPDKFRNYFDETYGIGMSTKVLQQMEQEEEIEKNKRGVVADVALQTIGGVADAVQETLDFGAGLTDAARKKGVPLPAYDFSQGKLLNADEVLKEREKRIEQGLDESFIDIPSVDDPDTMAGGLTKGVVQFATGFIGVGKVTRLKHLKWTKNRAFTRASIQGAGADTLVFDENMERFSDFINEYAPILSNPVTEYMASDPNDGFAEGRFKNALEGLMLGGAVETLFKIARGFKNGKKVIDEGGDPKKLKKVIDKESKGIEKELDKLDNEIDKFKKGKPYDEKFDLEAKPVRLKKKLVDKEVIDTLAVNLSRAKKGEISYDEALDIPFNINRITEDGVAEESLEALVRTIRDNAPDVFDGTESWSRVLRLADQLAENPVDLMRQMSRLAGEMTDGTAKVAATQIMLENLAKLLPQAARYATKTGDFKKIDTLTEIMAKYLHDWKIITKGSARITGFGRKGTGGKTKDVKWLLDEYAITGNKAKFLRKLANLDAEPHMLMRIWKSVLKSASWDKPNFFWINMILSNPKTHIVNMTSNFIVMAMRPLEQMAGAIWVRDRAAFLEGVDTLGGLFMYFKDSLKYAGTAFKNNDGILDVGLSKLENPTVIGKTKIGKATTNVIGAPTRALNAEDEFFKQISYRAKVYALGLKSARLKGLKPKSKEFSEHVADYFKKSFDDETMEGINPTALQFARENTFTQALEGGMSQHVQSMVAANPMLRQIIPFIRTPVNIYRAVAQRLPLLGAFQFQMRQALRSPDPAIRAQAYGKQAMGTALWGYAGYLAMSGRLTGGGSKNPEVKKAQLRTGWQPYSIKYGDKYYSYARLDPFGMILGIMADYYEISADVDDKTRNELAMAGQLYLLNNMETGSTFAEKAGRGVMATVKNLSSKTYLKGLSDILEAADSTEEWKWKKVWEGKLKSVVPNVLRNMNNDPYYRETRHWFDNIKSGIPYWSESLEPKYNFLGKPDERRQSTFDRMFNPMTVSEEQRDPLLEEIANLDSSFAAAQEKIGSVELANFKLGDKTAYARLNELIAEEDLEGQLREFIKSPKYQNASESFGTNDVNYQGSKAFLLQKIISKARKRALRNLRKESFTSENGLDLGEALDNDLRNKKNVKKNNLEDLLQVK